MNNQLLTLKQKVYHAAAEYHGASAQYFGAKRTRSDAPPTQELLDAGDSYRLVLNELLQHLTAQLHEPEEVARTRRTIELLDLEMGHLQEWLS